MKATCRSWFVCPMGVAVYLYLTPDMVERGPLKDWACPEYSKCKECSYAHTPSDKRRKGFLIKQNSTMYKHKDPKRSRSKRN